MFWRKVAYFTALSMLLSANVTSVVLAQNADSAGAQVSTTDAPATQGDATQPSGDAPKSSTMLQGGVKGAVLLMEDGLQKMGESTFEIKKSSEMMMQEVTRKQTQTIRSPNVLPNGVVIQPFPGPSGTIDFGNLPARKKKMDYLMNQLEYHYKLLSNEVDALMIPEEKFPTIATEWNQIVALRTQIGEIFDQLRDLTSHGDRYDNDKIGKQALFLYRKINSMDTLRRQVQRAVSQGS